MAETPIDVEVEKAFTNFRIERPILVTHAGDGSDRLFVPSQLGKMYVLPNDPSVEEPTEFLDISDRVVYIDRGERKGFPGHGVPSQVQGERRVLRLLHAHRHQAEHHGRLALPRFEGRSEQGRPRLRRAAARGRSSRSGITRAARSCSGPDGYLYIAIGDGGLANDPFKNGQNLNTLLGKILRIDVDHQDDGKKYAIPKDNPFVGQRGKRGRDLGLWPAQSLADRVRPQTGTLWCGDVGQDIWEEIDLIDKGRQLRLERARGVHKFGPNGSEPRPELIEPIWEYHHDVGKSITGGHVYRGQKLPQLDGCYLYADYVSGKVWALKYDEAKKEVVANYTISGNISPIMSFGEDEQGEAVLHDRRRADLPPATSEAVRRRRCVK